MANTFQLEILASDRPFYVGPAEQLVFPTVDGLMGILPGHESMVTVVSPGELKYLVDGQLHYAAISDGFAEVADAAAADHGDHRRVTHKRLIRHNVPHS